VYPTDAEAGECVRASQAAPGMDSPAASLNLDVAVAVAGAAVVVGVMISAVVLWDPMVVVTMMGLRERGRGRTPTDQGGHGKRRGDFFYSG
jgi:hypothetical protein